MAKKRVSVYMQQDDLDWLAKYPTADSVSGSAVLIMDWAMRQIRRGTIMALQKFDTDELGAIISYPANLLLTPDYSPAMLAMGLEDWFTYDVGRMLEWDQNKIDELISKCASLSPTEMMGLLAWANGFLGSGCKEVEPYIKNTLKLK